MISLTLTGFGPRRAGPGVKLRENYQCAHWGRPSDLGDGDDDNIYLVRGGEAPMSIAT